MGIRRDLTDRPSDPPAPVGVRGGVGRGRARRVLGAATLAVAGSLVLAGCTSGSGEAGPTTQGAVTPSPSVSTPAVTPSATPTPTKTAAATSGAPKRPAGMNANTREGAEKTALYFLSMDKYVQTTGDISEFDSLIVESKCGYCSNRRKQAVYVKKHGLAYVGGDLSYRVTKRYDYDSLYGAYAFDLEVKQKAFKIQNGSGKIVYSEPASRNTLSLEVMRSKKGWRILEGVTR
ncbi:DUF6318 family protein [Luteimicrobium sp. DT211]|uniref:DUF6318 family protein n=1 Tax=Luteimicrobium sp. DT211 TaxID=3393412 RepID=UPI003CF68190